MCIDVCFVLFLNQMNENLQTLFYLNQRIAGSCGNTALILLVTAHPDETFVTPRCTPRVLDDVIGLFAISVITNSENTVIEFG